MINVRLFFWHVILYAYLFGWKICWTQAGLCFKIVNDEKFLSYKNALPGVNIFSYYCNLHRFRPPFFDASPSRTTLHKTAILTATKCTILFSPQYFDFCYGHSGSPGNCSIEYVSSLMGHTFIFNIWPSEIVLNVNKKHENFAMLVW